MRYRASPKLIDSIIQSESDGNPYARSPVGAMGLMQVMPNTARNPGFGVEPLENPWDPEANKRFGTDYFNAMLNRYGGDREAALVAYNAGPGNADKWVSAGKDWSVLPKPEETRPYVTATLGRLGEDTDMATGSHIPLRARVDLPELRPETRITPRAVPRKTAEPLPTLPPPKSGASDIPGRPSKNDLSMAQALMQAGQRDAQNTRGTGLGLAGALAQQLSGAYMAGSYDDQQDQYNEALNEAFAGAEDRGDLMNVMMRSGDEGLRNAALKARLSKPKDDRTANERQYAIARQQGFEGSFMDFLKEKEGPQVVMKGETEYAKERGGALAKEYGTIQSEAQKARSRIGQLRQLDTLLSDPNVYTGTGAQAINAVKRAGKTLFGMDFQGVDKADAARRIVNEMALSFKGDLPGPMSDSDRQFLQEIPPNIGDTAQGRKLLVELMKQKEQRKVEMAQIAREYARANSGRLDDGWYDVAARYAEQNPMFDKDMMEQAKDVAGSAEQRSPYAGSYPSVQSAEDWEALEPGDYYFDPNGRLKQKKAR